MQTFKLVRAGEYGSVTPSAGEELGAALAGFALARETSFKEKEGNQVQYWGPMVAQLYRLAADAYQLGASASIGHNRADRYEFAARTCLNSAEQIEAAAEKQRRDIENAAMTRAFHDGYDTPPMGKPDAAHPSRRYSFDNREAYHLGEWFARTGMNRPEAVTINHKGRGKHTFTAGDCEYLVSYPTGKTNEPHIETIGLAVEAN